LSFDQQQVKVIQPVRWNNMFSLLHLVGKVSFILASAHFTHFRKVELAGIRTPDRRQLNVMLQVFKEPADTESCCTWSMLCRDF